MEQQLDFPFPYEERDLHTFLDQWIAIENEHDRLREQQRELREAYADKLPLRAVTTAVKRIRAMQKLEDHPKEPMARKFQAVLEGEIERHMAGYTKVLDAMTTLAHMPGDGGLTRITLETDGTRVDLTTGEVLEPGTGR